MKWITRERVRMDRVACAWVIQRFIDPQAEFLFVPPAGALERAGEEGAIPFVIPRAELSRKGDRISLDALLDKYGLDDPALRLLAGVVRAADIEGSKADAPEARGLRAIVHGFFLLELPDAQAVALQLPLFDALYRYCQERVVKGAGSNVT
jgi:hypothetical protein